MVASVGGFASSTKAASAAASTPSRSRVTCPRLPSPVSYSAEQHVLGADDVVAALAGHRLRGDHRGAGPGREALEPAGPQALDEPPEQPDAVPLLGGLAGHAEGLTDLVPGAPLVACRLDEVVEQLVAEGLHLVLERGGRGDSVERVGGVVALDDVDELFEVEVHGVNLALTLPPCQGVIDTCGPAPYLTVR